MLPTAFIIIGIVRLGFASRSILSKETMITLPTSFIVSTTLDVGPSSNKSESAAHILQSEVNLSDLNFRDRSAENDKFYNFQKNKNNGLVNSAPADKNSPKINFYSMNCAAGHKCTAIIPGPKTPIPITKHRSKDEMKKYLKKHGLEKGFNYSDDDRVNRHNIVARYFRDGSENKARVRNVRKGRRIGNKFYDYEDYWPGSEYRPKVDNNKLSVNSKAKIYKYGIKSFDKKGFDSNSWNNAPSSIYNYEQDYSSSYEFPYPKFSKNGNNANIRYPTELPYSDNKNKGGWNRYSSSVISQYDRDSKDWVKISTSNTDLGSGFVNTQHKQTFQKGSATKGPSVSLTVLGLPGIDDPYYTKNTNRPSYGQSYNPFQQDQKNYFSQSSYRPFPPTETKPSVSYPLNVLRPDLSINSLIFSNDRLNANDSDTNDTLHSDAQSDLSNTTTVAPEITQRTTRLPITQRNQFLQQIQQTSTVSVGGEGGDNGDDGGGGGGIVTNAYAVMAAVGAGLIPASIAAILPVLLGRRKKRSLEAIWKDPFHRTFHQRWEGTNSLILQSMLESLSHPTLQGWSGGPYYPITLEARSPPDPIIKLLLRSSHTNR